MCALRHERLSCTKSQVYLVTPTERPHAGDGAARGLGKGGSQRRCHRRGRGGGRRRARARARVIGAGGGVVVAGGRERGAALARVAHEHLVVVEVRGRGAVCACIHMVNRRPIHTDIPIQTPNTQAPTYLLAASSLSPLASPPAPSSTHSPSPSSTSSAAAVASGSMHEHEVEQRKTAERCSGSVVGRTTALLLLLMVVSTRTSSAVAAGMVVCRGLSVALVGGS